MSLARSNAARGRNDELNYFEATDPLVVLPAERPRQVRHVGVVGAYVPQRGHGAVVLSNCNDGAHFSIDDVAPADRPVISVGQDVSFLVSPGPDGIIAKKISLDTTTLPPLPTHALFIKGWR